MRILITGGSGYLGGRIAKYFSNKGEYNIVLATRIKKTLPKWADQVEVTCILWDSDADLMKICANIDVIIHLAGANASDCSDDRLHALEVNAVNTNKLLQSAIKQKVKRFIYLSTAHVYNAPLTGRITEETCPTNIHPYATSHKAGEDVVRYAFSKGEIEGIVVRLSNSFGAPVHIDVNCWMLLVNDLCMQAVTSGKIKLQSSGSQVRDFITITDVSRALDHLIKLSFNRLDNGLFNVGGEWCSTVFEMAELVAERTYILTGKRVNIQINSKRQGKSNARRLDYVIDKIKATGFKLKGNANDEIDDLLRFCVENHTL